ncbi:MAG: MATE family efflux transporter [Myxococcota bacterium]
MGRNRTELRQLLQLAWPVVLGQIGQVLMGVEDLIMVGDLGAGALAAVGMGNLWSFGVLVLGFGALRGADPLFSQAYGARDDARAALWLGRAVLLAVMLTVPIMAAHLLAAPGLAALEQPAEAIPAAAGYACAVMWGTAPMLLFNVLSQHLQARNQVLLPTLVILGGNVLNVLLNGLFLHVLEWGVVGVGWSTAIGRLASMVALFALCADGLRRLPAPSVGDVFSLAGGARLLRLGAPIGVQYGLEVWAFNATGLMVGWLGTAALAAHQIALNISALAFMMPFGLSIAASVRVGNRLGAGEDWTRSAATAIIAASAWMGICALGLWLAAPALTRAYTDDAGVIEIAVLLLPIAAAFQLFDGIQAVCAGVLRGVGDTRSPAIVNLIGFWGIGLPVGYLLGVHANSPPGVWYGLIVGLGVVSALLLARVRGLARGGVSALA